MKYYSNVNRIVVMFSIVCIFLLLTSCSTDTVSTDETHEQITEEITVITYTQTIIATTISELTLRSDIVVIGNVISTENVVNMARNPENPSEPDPSYFGIGKIYDVEVEQYLKGNGDKTIHLVQDQGFFRVVDSSKDVSTELIEKTISSHKHIPIEEGNTYLLFLRLIPHDVKGYPFGSLFAPTLHPWLFSIGEKDDVQVIDENSEPVDRWFPNKSLDTIISEIKNPKTQDTELPYPPPPVMKENSDEKKSPYP